MIIILIVHIHTVLSKLLEVSNLMPITILWHSPMPFMYIYFSVHIFSCTYISVMLFISQTYCVVSSVGEPCNQVVHIQGEGEKETEFVEKSE